LAATDDVIVSVSAAANLAPIVNAGPDQTITLPAMVNLAGTATDDGLPVGSTLSGVWSKVSGPGTVTFGGINAPSTTATFSAAGTYVLRLTATDGLLSASSSLSVTVLTSTTGTKTIFVSQNKTGAGTGIDCSNSLPVSFVNNPANWGLATTQIGPGTTVTLCGAMADGIESMFLNSTRTESNAIPSFSLGNPEPKIHPVFLIIPGQ
jgi:hypothetical protein